MTKTTKKKILKLILALIVINALSSCSSFSSCGGLPTWSADSTHKQTDDI
jgi:hypothetical protein